MKYMGLMAGFEPATIHIHRRLHEYQRGTDFHDSLVSVIHKLSRSSHLSYMRLYNRPFTLLR